MWPLAARVQQSMPVIGCVNSGTAGANAKNIAAFRAGLTEAGFAPQVLDLSLEIPPEQVERHRLVKFGRMEPIFLCR